MPQLIPSASTRSPSSIATTDGTSPPVKSFPRSSKIIVTKIGRFVRSFAASTAALTS
ncbi:hypothetical protein EVA_17495 [gut metagenome]|uniref:Uncharacterized protein n=1 Tax=gut metagenome TaxID=749906 RepID=J9C3K4_9ZZZZ